ncbi:hypothetical protein Bhyg_12909 [Pseudolycoriella hygida]|uniref:Uncharacterized protein n=1 Tax=Pseudolycoriella hygida TaxID=35572 RepID=A0A9Q0MZQ1_9DIPT|nr:hypothetical protein Bhyg_12909 [Pseudolycoriella hygida]
MSPFSVLFVLLLATFSSIGNCDDNKEASELALEAYGQLLAPRHLVPRISRDLSAIRDAYPAVKNIIYSPPWVPGTVLAKLRTGTLNDIRRKYGNFKTKPLMTDWTILEFSKPYNPEVLAKKLVSKNFAELAEPNRIIGQSSSIKYEIGSGVYTFKSGWGDCQAGCINNHYWVFKVHRNA